MEENQSVLVSFAKIVFCAGLIDLKGISGSSPAVESSFHIAKCESELC